VYICACLFAIILVRDKISEYNRHAVHIHHYNGIDYNFDIRSVLSRSSWSMPHCTDVYCYKSKMLSMENDL